MLRDLLKHRLELGCPVSYIDATNLTAYERRPYIQLAYLYDCDIEAIFIDVPIDECQRRNQARNRVVPAEAIIQMSERLAPPTIDEGFRRVMVVK